jgi:hypothetical protein
MQCLGLRESEVIQLGMVQIGQKGGVETENFNLCCSRDLAMRTLRYNSLRTGLKKKSARNHFAQTHRSSTSLALPFISQGV